MNLREYLKNHIVVLDGGMGTLLQQRGLNPGEFPERWNISHPDEIRAIHKAYFDAGSNIVSANTFGANALHFEHDELELIVKTALDNAKTARRQSDSPQEKFIALDVGPTGKLLKPMGDLDFEDAVSVFSEVVRLGVKYGADLVFIETMNDSYETKAALLAAKENSDLPVFVSNAYSENGKLMTGASPAAMVAMLEGMGADAVGVNCSFGPDRLEPIVREYLAYSSLPVILKANAGLPQSVDGKTVYNISAAEFSKITARLVADGVSLAGGCCGTTPEYIRLLKSEIGGVVKTGIEKKDFTVVSSSSHAVFFSDSPVLIGERINPTGKKRFKEALRENDLDYILSEGIKQQDAGAHVLDVNVGLPEIDEPKMLENVVCELQAVTDLPLQIDTSDPVAMERALRRYNGKAMLNSVNGKKASMDAVFPLMKKYGGVAVALTLDEQGIPDTAEGRVAIAKRIVETAARYGIGKNNLIFDTLAMAVSADKNAAAVTLESLRRIHDELGVHTSLGVSNISFGLPKRDFINASFFTSALENGLSAAIMNPFSAEMMKAYHTFRVLHGLDENCAGYISFAENVSGETEVVNGAKKSETDEKADLRHAIIKGLKEQAAKLTENLLETEAPLDVVQSRIIPALDEVGVGYERGEVYLPGLLMSAEAAKSAFEEIKKNIAVGGETAEKKCAFVLATVKGDIHDIGKNIVKLLLENYGFEVIDLGKDVPPEVIVNKAVEIHAPLVGLSALMTTTVSAMEETIKQLRERAPWVKVAVGGAVLTQEYADSIGADRYCKDAMDTVRYAEEMNALC